MKFSGKVFAIVGAVLAAMIVVAVPVLAQDTPPGTPDGNTIWTSGGYPLNTITVVGTGVIRSSPDEATVQIGVDVTNASVTEAFAEANTKIKAVVDALTALGIASEDITTTNLNVYTNNNPDFSASSDGGVGSITYTVSNTVQVVVRDVAKVSEVIDTAIAAGATSLYGLSFDVADHAPLESQAREKAVADAQARAEEYASLIGATLGDVVVVNENVVGGAIPLAAYDSRVAQAGGAFISPGQTEVQIQVQVTYQISR